MNSVSVGGTSATPSKIVCIGKNYVQHIEELGDKVPDSMVVFLKPNSAIGVDLQSSRQGEALHYEGEIALMVRGGRYAAVAFGLDLTRRELQSGLKAAGLPWERAKAFDGAALFSPFVALPASLDSLEVQLCIDGVERQRGSTSMMLYPPSVILEELSAFTTLEDGDIVMTGTPAGVGPVTPGSEFHGRILSDGATLTEGRWRSLAMP